MLGVRLIKRRRQQCSKRKLAEQQRKRRRVSGGPSGTTRAGVRYSSGTSAAGEASNKIGNGRKNHQKAGERQAKVKSCPEEGERRRRSYAEEGVPQRGRQHPPNTTTGEADGRVRRNYTNEHMVQQGSPREVGPAASGQLAKTKGTTGTSIQSSTSTPVKRHMNLIARDQAAQVQETAFEQTVTLQHRGTGHVSEDLTLARRERPQIQHPLTSAARSQ